jgi:putative ABC transport system permease protein
MIPLSYNLRSLAVRRATSFAAAFGIALVVFVFASVLMLQQGIRTTLGTSGRPDNVIVIRKGSDAELASGIEDSKIGLMRENAEVAKAKSGGGLGLGETVLVITAEKIGTDGGISNVTIRGTPELVWEFRPETTIIAGRKPQPGTNEVVVGKAIRGRFKGTELGQEFDLRKNRPVKVVGIIESGGSSFESEVWGDLDFIRSAFSREGSVSSVRVRLSSPSKFDAFKAQVESDKQLGLSAERETVYYEKQSEGLAMFLGAMGTIIAVLFSFGAIIGAMITMYASIANRSKEIGTLRALGFSRGGILLSFLFEALVLALVGGAVGALAAQLMGFVSFATVNFATFSEIVFRFQPTPSIIITAMVIATVIGLFGGLAPAIRASRVSPIQAMRE